MEIRISPSVLRISKAYLLALSLAVGSSEACAQAMARSGAERRSSAARITEWQDDLYGALHILHVLFPNLNPEAKTIILDNGKWGPYDEDSFPRGMVSFAVFVCEPDSPPTEEQRRDVLNLYTIHCSALTMYAGFLMGGSQLGRVPDSIMIARPTFKKRWSDLSDILQAHTGWSKTQMEDAMRSAGLKYGQNSRKEVVPLIHDSATKLEPFLGKLIIDSIDYSSPFLPPSSKELSPPVWHVEAHPSGQDKTKPQTKYVLIFSAFDGALESAQKLTSSHTEARLRMGSIQEPNGGCPTSSPGSGRSE